MDEPNIRLGDITGFSRFALKVRALVGMLKQQGQVGRSELQCGSHVAKLTRKLPHDLCTTFRRNLLPNRREVPTLMDLAEWLEDEFVIQEGVDRQNKIEEPKKEGGRPKRERWRDGKHTTVLHGSTQDPSNQGSSTTPPMVRETQERPKSLCSFCNNSLHYLDQCANFKLLTKKQKEMWVRSSHRCWRCGHCHQAAQCRLKTPCKTCRGKHLDVLHDVNLQRQLDKQTEKENSTTEILYRDRRAGCNQVLLKISKVILSNGEHSLETYAILDDGPERTVLLQDVAQKLKLSGEPESLTLRTVRQTLQTLKGVAVDFTLSPANQPNRRYTIKKAFSATHLGLADHT